jgi:hypothetical protein
MQRFILAFGVLLFLVAIYTITAHAQLISIPIPGSPLSLTVMANPQPLQDLRINPAATNITMGDDSNVNVPLQFTFPFYGQNFTNSWMYSNGAVNFKGSNAPGGFCCSGLPLTTSLNSGYNYSIMPLWADLIAYQAKNGSHYKLGTSNSMTYGWYNVSEYGVPNNLSSFEVKIDNTGLIDMRFIGALVTYHPVTIGTIGDASKGEFTQNYYSASGINITSAVQLSNGVVDMCVINPTSSPACPGYQMAMCTTNSLFRPSCPGYQEAYFTQQCSINSLYDTGCPGYATAYLNYRCSENSLYSTTCSGYASAYLNQQCNITPFYSTSCSTYAQASTTCSANPLYATYCPNYTLASQVCSNNQLTYTYCPSYNTVLASCSTNSQSNTLCPNYSLSPTTTSSAPTIGSTIVSTTQPSISVSSNGTVSTAVALVSDSNVNQVITSRATSTDAAASAAPVNVVRQEAPSQQSSTTEPMAVAQRQDDKREEKKEEKKTDDTPKSTGSSTSSQSVSNTPTASETKNEPKTTRQEIAEKRQEAARAKAVESGKNLANEMGKATSMEQQVAVQNVVLQAMGYSPGFAGYTRGYIPDVAGYKPYTAYANQKNVDNARLSRGLFGATDRLHNDMVESQYQLEQ